MLHIQLAFEQIGIGFVPNSDKDALQIYLPGGVVFYAFDSHAGNTGLVTQYFIQHVIPFDGDIPILGFLNQLVSKDLL